MIYDKLDNQTIKFLEELQSDYNIDFVEKEIDYCEVFQKNGNATIYYNPKIIDTETITHELLHIWLNKFNYTIGNYIYIFTNTHPKLQRVFNKFLCDNIENFFDHYKMYPKYKEMGYSPEKFIKNGLEEQCSIKDINRISIKFLNTYNSNSINLFIGCLLSIYADHVEHNYEEHLRLMHQKDKELFIIVTKFWRTLEEFDITNIEENQNLDIEICENLVADMESWIENKKIK